jgi:DNA repair protein RecO (recombination protein O)
MNIKTDGIILRETMTGEQDRLVTVLTRSNGVIKAFVNGARNPKNKNVSSTGLLCYSDFMINKTQKGVYVIREATAKEMFFSLRNDIVNLSLAQYFAELTYELSPREEDSSEFLSLILNSLYLLSTGKRSRKIIKSVIELRMLTLAGYMPSIICCENCGAYESEVMYFSPYTGQLYCELCRGAQKLTRLNLATVTAMRHICFSTGDKIFNFKLPEEHLNVLYDVSERYLINITSRKYKTLAFYKTMADD